MSVSSGFFNSLNGDRKYNAAQMSAIFDGLIIDGVFASIGTAFAVKAAGGLTVNVGIGKAWFDHTWTVNDSILPMTAPEAEVLLDRIDAVVLEVNGMESVRNNTIKFVKGNPSSAPSRPTLTNEGNVHQYPLCYIYRKYGTAVINQAELAFFRRSVWTSCLANGRMSLIDLLMHDLRKSMTGLLRRKAISRLGSIK